MILEKYKLLPPAEQKTVDDFIEFLFWKNRHNRIAKTIQGIGFKDEYQFAFLRLFGVDQRLALAPKTENNQLQVTQALEKIEKNLTDYLHTELVAFLQEQIAEFSQEIAYFEQKYQMTWEEMHTRFHELNQFDMIEKEDDDMNWVTYLDLKAASTKTLQKLHLWTK